MKYVFLFCGTTESQAQWETMTPEQTQQAYARVGEWFGKYESRITGGEQLQGPQTATTVLKDSSGRPVVKDGPFIEGKEVIGGYAEVEVDDLDQALEMAKEWPAGPVEIRPAVPRMAPAPS
jgi:hypothetical protein